MTPCAVTTPVIILLALTCAGGLLAPPGLPAQSSDTLQALWIHVSDAGTGRPVAGAEVRVTDRPRARALTDPSGVAQLNVDAGARLVVTSRLGFRPDTTVLGAAHWAAGVVGVTLRPIAQPLAPVRVTEESPDVSPMMREFDARRSRRGGGATFIGPEDFARHPSSRVTDFLRRGVVGVKLVDSAGVLLPVSARGEVVRAYQNQRSGGGGRDGMERVYCTLRIVVDGVPKEWGFDLNSIDPREVYGVEVYAGPATVPVQYRSMGRDGYCGLVMIWTRER